MSRLRFVADENLDERLVLAVLRRLRRWNVVRVRDVGLAGRTDEELLEWAARQRRIVITHDARTMPAATYGRIADQSSMPGVLIVPTDAVVRAVVEDLVLIAEVGTSADFRDRVVFLPLTG